MDYLCGKLGDCSFSRLGYIVWTNRLADVCEHFTPVILVGVNTVYCC